MDQSGQLTLRQKAARYSEDFMRGGKFDASHDWSHIQRVVETSLSILAVERARVDAPPYNEELIYLAALLHDITDHKYVDPNSTEDLDNKISALLREMGASESLAHSVEVVSKNVSYSHEIRDPSEAEQALRQYPELGIVQDADRLDAIGGVGIARVFAYTGASSARGQPRTLVETIDHFHEKLERVGAMMKTREGRRRAEERTSRLKQFRVWFAEELAADI